MLSHIDFRSIILQQISVVCVLVYVRLCVCFTCVLSALLLEPIRPTFLIDLGKDSHKIVSYDGKLA